MITTVSDKEIAQDATIEQLRQEVTAWHITAENLEAELERERRTHCACVFDGDTYVKQCELHAAWKDTLHEQADYRRERDALKEDLAETRLVVVEQRNAMLSRGHDDFIQALTDPENQPSQWGTVTMAMYQAVEAERDALNEAVKGLTAQGVSLAADAARWRDYQARKVSLKAAGFGKSPLRSEAPDTYAVINKEGDVEYSASWPEACHDYIKDMQDAAGLGYVVGWKVRAIKILPTYKDIAIKEANHAI